MESDIGSRKKTASLILLGSTSEIGNSVVRGLVRRTQVEEIIRVGRTEYSANRRGTERFIPIEEFFRSPDATGIVGRTSHLVLSIGALGSTLVDKLDSENLFQMLEVNVFANLRFLERFVEASSAAQDAPRYLELHFVSSILADFARKGAVDYSLSKQIIEKKLLLWSRENQDWVNLYLWKPAFVRTKFHIAPRNNRTVETSLAEIERAVFTQSKPGVYYLPSWVRVFSVLLSAFPPLADVASAFALRGKE